MDIENYTSIILILSILVSAFWMWRRYKARPNKNLLIAYGLVACIFIGLMLAFTIWRNGTVVAKARFDPGIAPFTLTVRKVPVPVTRSNHFIVKLNRGQYPITSFRYFWINYTPTKVEISWPELEYFTVTFDEKYIARCAWSWGKNAQWTMSYPDDALAPGTTLTATGDIPSNN